MNHPRLTERAITRSLIAAGIVLALPLGAIAQTAAQTAAITDATATKADDAPVEPVVVVTAFKRSSTLLKTPAALSVLSGDNLREQGVNDLTNIQDVIPGLVIANTMDGVQVAMRGVQANDTSSKGEQDIAFNVDGVNIGRGNARGGAFFDIDRIEVLRGPQGTLYGRSSTGGAINVITNKPQLGQTSGYAKLEFGNFNAQRAEAAINIPLGEMLAFRAAGVSNTRDGYSHPIDYTTSYNGTTYYFPASASSVKNDQRDRAGRFSLLFKPVSDTTLQLTQTVSHQGGTGTSQALETQMQAHNDTGSAALNILPNPVQAFLDSHNSNTAAVLDTRLSDIQLKVLGSHQYLNYRQQLPSAQDVYANGLYRITPYFGDDAFGPAFNFRLNHHQVRTDQFETTIANADASTIEYVAGVNWYREKAGENGQNWNALLWDPLDTATYLSQSGPVNLTTHESKSVFGQATWHLNERVGIIGGLRYTNSDVRRVGTFALPFNFNAGFPPPPYGDDQGNAICVYPNSCVGALNNGEAKDSKVTWKVGLNYQMAPEHLFYTSVATGFKAGGFNDYDPATKTLGQYAASSLTAYEVGYKGRLLPALTLSSSLYYYDFSKNQIAGVTNFVGGQSSPYTQTVPTKIYGWENEGSYKLARETTLSGSVALLHTKFVHFLAGKNAFVGDPIDFSGQELDSSPKLTATLSISHAINLGNGAKVKLRASSKYSSSYLLSDLGNGVRYRQPSFTRSEASVAYEPAQSSVKVQLFVTNIENKIQRTGGLTGYDNSGSPYGGSGSTTFSSMPANNLAFNVNEPRMYGIRLSTDF
ncbi:TonB-dependent receptor plug domain-containing protein [Duganella sp. FT80W]|uniref:TonB-dependent receptor plug domain-containing protein n=1 Tax=Duganella guangzhouensis TaxID=2666084 RepID=A0A6I2L4D5_9BURK|nr:TonB-dependent receptor [Duganella guangzhouensis]MRW91466.1 TonB-dependent receptor plug domain-containing protein [Duganella guangzhouensis]